MPRTLEWHYWLMAFAPALLPVLAFVLARMGHARAFHLLGAMDATAQNFDRVLRSLVMTAVWSLVAAAAILALLSAVAMAVTSETLTFLLGEGRKSFFYGLVLSVFLALVLTGGSQSPWRRGEIYWLALLMVLVQSLIVLLRYVFGEGLIALQEAMLYMHGMLFLLAAGYTLIADGHVRVDLIYREAKPRTKAWIDFLGALFLLIPVMAVIFWLAWPYVIGSWQVLEGSRETSGIPAVFLLKSCILLFALMMWVQGIGMASRKAAELVRPAAAPAPA
ncbi:MAG TPA: TRAP transporter small permease subunit [Micropepsaceae bacterium]|nr:TRAP transporter small permease subunit [Micropepsaceae bacterium]